jgi:hypothetical protein
MVQGTGIVAPLDWTFALDVFLQVPQNTATEVCIHDLSWWDKFLVHNVFSAKKTNQHTFDIVSNKSCILRSR